MPAVARSNAERIDDDELRCSSAARTRAGIGGAWPARKSAPVDGALIPH